MAAPAHLLLSALSGTALSDRALGDLARPGTEPAGGAGRVPPAGAGASADPAARSKRVAAPAAASRPPADHAPQAESRPLVFGPEGAATGAPLTSEPPLPDAEPLTSEPPLAESAPLTSEWTGERGGEWDTEPAGDGPGRAEA